MKKLFIILLILVAVVLGWYLLSDTDTSLTTETTPVEFALESEIAELEAELATVDAAVKAGTLTEAQATEAKAQIVTKIATIEAMSNTPAAGLTASQRLQLSGGLTRLENILTTYRSTLVEIDATADPVAVKNRVRSIQNSTRTTAAADTVATAIIDTDISLSEMINDLVEGVEELKETVDEMIEDGTLTDDQSEMNDDASTEDMTDDKSESTTDDSETMSDDTTTTDDSDNMNTVSDDGMDGSDDTTTDASTTIEADAGVDVTN